LETLLEGYEKFVKKFGELVIEDVPMHLFTLKVGKITPQRDDFDPSRLKRGITVISVNERSKESSLKAIIQFRGRTLILSMKEGTFSIEDVAKRLSLEYGKKYPKENLKADGVFDGGRVHHYTVSDPGHFLDFLHWIREKKGLDIASQQGEHVWHQMAEWLRKRPDGTTPKD